MNWTILGLVMSGGALGAAGRYLVGDLAMRHFSNGMPWGTLIVNLIGSFAAGYCYIWLESRGTSMLYWRAFLMVGILGGLTTYSALMLECLVHFRADKNAQALLYLSITLLIGLFLVWLGARTAEIFNATNTN